MLVLPNAPAAGPVTIGILGLQLRDYFAAQCVAVAAQDPQNLTDEDVAQGAYLLADELLKARDKK